jgi:hypothetical protein
MLFIDVYTNWFGSFYSNNLWSASSLFNNNDKDQHKVDTEDKDTIPKMKTYLYLLHIYAKKDKKGTQNTLHAKKSQEWITTGIKTVISMIKGGSCLKDKDYLNFMIALHSAIVKIGYDFDRRSVGRYPQDFFPHIHYARHVAVKRSVEQKEKWELDDVCSLLVSYPYELDFGLPGINHEHNDWLSFMTQVCCGQCCSDAIQTYYPGIAVALDTRFSKSFCDVLIHYRWELVDFLMCDEPLRGGIRIHSFKNDVHTRGTFQAFLCAVLYVNATKFLNVLEHHIQIYCNHFTLNERKKDDEDDKFLCEAKTAIDIGFVAHTVMETFTFIPTHVVKTACTILYGIYWMVVYLRKNRVDFPMIMYGEYLDVSPPALYHLVMSKEYDSDMWKTLCMKNPWILLHCIQEKNKSYNKLSTEFLDKIEQFAPYCILSCWGRQYNNMYDALMKELHKAKEAA